MSIGVRISSQCLAQSVDPEYEMNGLVHRADGLFFFYSFFNRIGISMISMIDKRENTDYHFFHFAVRNHVTSTVVNAILKRF